MFKGFNVFLGLFNRLGCFFGERFWRSVVVFF